MIFSKNRKCSRVGFRVGALLSFLYEYRAVVFTFHECVCILDSYPLNSFTKRYTMNRICLQARRHCQWTLVIMLYFTPFAMTASVATRMKKNLQSDSVVTPCTLSLKEVLDDLEMRYGISFIYEDGTVSDKQVVKEVEYRAQLEATLNVLLTPLGLKFKKINDRTYAISRMGFKRKKDDRRSVLSTMISPGNMWA